MAAASALLLVSPAASGADDTKAQVLKEAAKLPEVGQQDAVGAQTRTNGERPDSGVKVPSKDTARPAAPEDKADHGARKNDRPDVPREPRLRGPRIRPKRSPVPRRGLKGRRRWAEARRPGISRRRLKGRRWPTKRPAENRHTPTLTLAGEAQNLTLMLTNVRSSSWKLRTGLSPFSCSTPRPTAWEASK